MLDTHQKAIKLNYNKQKGYKMSAMKALLQDAANIVHTGNVEELEDLLTGWKPEERLNLIMEAIRFNGIITDDCSCTSHKLSAYAGSDS